jgi:hypothetical protein
MGNSKTKKRAAETMTKLGKHLVLASKMMYCHYYSDLSIKIAFYSVQNVSLTFKASVTTFWFHLKTQKLCVDKTKL